MAGVERQQRSGSPHWPKARATSIQTVLVGCPELERSLAAVTAGLTLPWSSRVVEGHVNQIKMIKRRMFGRAGFQLLRKRVLLA
ncbi:hypothetical protein ACIRPT_37280 [Streptomyces sp. NPDC101227]|uniref:hypothetical protein n=1 Tax=Streptomyces sp. NPDC101227 TaxID=3366136 RepID=UPI003823EB4F